MRKKSIRKFIFLSILILIGIFFTVVPFSVPFTYYRYNSFIGAIKLGMDLDGGVAASFKATLAEGSTSDFDKNFDNTITRISELFDSEGYSDVLVNKQSGNDVDTLRIEVAGVDNDKADVLVNIYNIFSLISSPAKLEIKATKSDTAEAALTGNDIDQVYASYQNGSYGVVIKFTDEGTTKFKDLTTTAAGSSIYIYIGGSLYSQPSVDSAISNGVTFISGSNMESLADAREFAMKIFLGSPLGVNLTVLDKGAVTPLFGQNSLLAVSIVCIAALVILMIVLALKYKMLGVCADISLVIYAVLLLFFMQAIPLVQLTLPGVVALLLGLVIAATEYVIIYSKIKSEYRLGKKIPASVDSGFKKSLGLIVDINVIAFVTSLVFYLLGTSDIKSFTIILMIGIVLSMFINLLINKKLIRWYLAINSVDGKKMNLNREADSNENN